MVCLPSPMHGVCQMQKINKINCLCANFVSENRGGRTAMPADCPALIARYRSTHEESGTVCMETYCGKNMKYLSFNDLLTDTP